VARPWRTAAVRALLGAAARGPRPVSFFNRKGADCLGKYMGEAERSLRLLFQEAERRAGVTEVIENKHLTDVLGDCGY